MSVWGGGVLLADLEEAAPEGFVGHGKTKIPAHAHTHHTEIEGGEVGYIHQEGRTHGHGHAHTAAWPDPAAFSTLSRAAVLYAATLMPSATPTSVLSRRGCPHDGHNGVPAILSLITRGASALQSNICVSLPPALSRSHPMRQPIMPYAFENEKMLST